MKILILCCLILDLTVSNAECKSTSIAVYELTNAQITFNKLMLELYHPLTDKPTGEYAIFSAPAENNFSLDAIIPKNTNTPICLVAKIEQKPVVGSVITDHVITYQTCHSIISCTLSSYHDIV